MSKGKENERLKEERLVSELVSVPLIARATDSSPSPYSESPRLKAGGRKILRKRSKTEKFSNA